MRKVFISYCIFAIIVSTIGIFAYVYNDNSNVNVESTSSRFIVMSKDKVDQDQYAVTLKDINTGCLYSYIADKSVNDVTKFTAILDKNGLPICEK